MSTVLFWFRADLRLTDNPALHAAIAACAASGNTSNLLPVFCHDPSADALTSWGFQRVGPHRRRFLRDVLDDLSAQLRALGSDLIELHGTPSDVLPAVAQAVGAKRLVCEAIAAPEEAAAVDALRAAGLVVDTIWQSSLLDPADLPFAADRVPDMFTAFRNAVEKAEVLPPLPLSAPDRLPALPVLPASFDDWRRAPVRSECVPAAPDARSSFPYYAAEFSGGATAAQRHLDHYFEKKLAHTYKQTRNGLAGTDYSTKFSPWLASGAISARTIHARLKQFEDEHGANDSTYWIWFELLWRDHFRLLHLKHGRTLYRARGLGELGTPSPRHHAGRFARWCSGTTGEPIVDAGMRELAATGYLSNRLRQIVASYLIHDLGGDWRAGAAWFEAQLVDYDVYSNQGNWLYLAGRGTDPRGGRRFNPQKQAADYDADGAYRALWLTPD